MRNTANAFSNGLPTVFSLSRLSFTSFFSFLPLLYRRFRCPVGACVCSVLCRCTANYCGSYPAKSSDDWRPLENSFENSDVITEQYLTVPQSAFVAAVRATPSDSLSVPCPHEAIKQRCDPSVCPSVCLFHVPMMREAQNRAFRVMVRACTVVCGIL